jgi:hypothetical protein
MLCYSCAEQGIETTAIALCRSCYAGLCMDHLRETASHFTSGRTGAQCHHDTWTARQHPSDAPARAHAPSRS